MSKVKKEPPEHKDRLCNPIKLGDKLAVAHHNSLRICSVTKLNPKMIEVTPVNPKYANSEFLVYSHETVVLNEADVLVYIIKGFPG